MGRPSAPASRRKWTSPSEAGDEQHCQRPGSARSRVLGAPPPVKHNRVEQFATKRICDLASEEFKLEWRCQSQAIYDETYVRLG